MSANAQQRIDWNGDSGAGWLANQERLDRMLAPFGAAALDRALLRPGEHVLDIGCGSGESTLAIADRVGPSGLALGIDISEPLLGRARERAVDILSLADFRLADASSTPLPMAGFDCLFSRFGVMFFDDPMAAFSHLRTCLKPGGRFVFACWRGAAENDWTKLPMTAIRDMIPADPPSLPEAPGPFSFGDPRRVERLLAGAGFTDIDLDPLDRPIVFGRGTTKEEAVDDALGRAFAVGPLRRALAGKSDDVTMRAAAAVHAAFARRVIGREVVIDGAAWIVSARNPR
ncbi:MAG: methyltransferase domain-containing protein [Sphingobium sp.]